MFVLGLLCKTLKYLMYLNCDRVYKEQVAQLSLGLPTVLVVSNL